MRDGTAMRSDDAPALVVIGGAGGTTARIEALVAAAQRLVRAADSLDRCGSQVVRAAGAVEATATVCPATASAVRWPAQTLVHGPAGLRATGALLTDAAERLRSVAAGYARADADAAARLRALAVLGGTAVGDAGPLAAAGALLLGTAALLSAGRTVVHLRSLRHTPTPVGLGLTLLGGSSLTRAENPVGMVARLVAGPGLLPDGWLPPAADGGEIAVSGLAAVVTGLAPGLQTGTVADPVGPAARAAYVTGTVGAAALGRPRHRLVVAPQVTVGAEQPPAPRTTADVLRQVQDLYPENGAAPGSVGVQRLDHPDGRRTWVVTVPGTQSAGLHGSNPMDMATNLALASGTPDDVTHLVSEAMLRAGVGPEEPVLIAGHSQGGMAAVRAASGLHGVFTVAGVVTAGSPVGGMSLPAEIPALHLEHLQDQVVALDGRPNPDVTHRTTVVRDLGAGSAADRAAARSLGAPHLMPAYIRTAEALEGSGHRSLEEFDAAMGRVLGDGSADATHQRYVGVRVSAASDCPSARSARS